MARRYHWHSNTVKSFVENPHAFIYGKNQGEILNFVDLNAAESKTGILNIIKENPAKMFSEIQKVIMPSHHEVRASNVNLKRLGSMLDLAHDRHLQDFESLLMLEGVGPRTIQSLALVREVIHGTPTRFSDPVRFYFAHGGKDGHPFPVPIKVYDETIAILRSSIEQAKIGDTNKQLAIKNLTLAAQSMEKIFEPDPNAFDRVIAKELAESYKYGGRTVFRKSKPPKDDGQLNLF